MATLIRGVVKRCNTIEENKKVLSELLRKSECLEPSQEELNRLFTRLNDQKARYNTKNLKSYEPACRGKKVLDPIYGPVPGIPCGSWWGIRMDCSRDRMHDPFSASVQCGPVGAASICTSGETSDVDLGDVLSFTGRSSEEENCEDRLLGELDENRALVLNFENRVPIRVVRSYNLSNEYSPKTGYRYDGLYMVVDYWIAVSERNDSSCYKFALKRLSHQDSPAWINSGTKYPVSCDPRRLTRTPVSRGEKAVMRLRNRESKTMKVVKSVRKRRRSSSEGNEKFESVQVTTPTTTMLLHALPGRKTMADNKNVNVSAIVTRRVSKKLQKNSVDKLPMHDCAKFGVGEIQPGNERGDEDAQSQSTRLQNTNISIRTDLYDSSHNLKQSVKKCGSQASHGIGIFKPRVLPVQRRDITFAGMDSGPGSSRTTSCVKMERVKANHEAESERCSKGELDLGPHEIRDEDKTEFCEAEAAGSFEGPLKGLGNSSWPETSIMMNSLTLEKVLDIIRDDKSSPMAKMLISNVIGAHPVSQERQNTENIEKMPPTIKTSSFENSGQQRIIEIVYSGDESNLTQESGEDSKKERNADPVVEQSEENDILRVQTRNRNTCPLGSEDAADFCWDKPAPMMREEKKLWEAQNNKISNGKIITRSKCVQNAENTDVNSRLNVAEADATGRDKTTNKMKLEMANLFIDMNMSPSSRVSESRSRRSLRGANYSRRRTCPAVVDRGRKRRNDEQVKHPSSPLKRLKKNVVKIQNNSGKILGGVISKKGLSLRKKTRNNLNNNNNNNNTNNNNNSVKRIGNSDKSTMISKKVEKKNSAIPKRRDTKERILTRSKGGLNVGRLRLRRPLLPGVETYPRKKKKTKEKQKPTTVEKRKIVSSDDKQSKRAKVDYKTNGGGVEKPEMVSVMTQCSLIPDSPNRCGSTSEYLCSSRNSEADRVKNENIELIEIKSEALDDDVAPCDQEDEDPEENHQTSKIGGSISLGLSKSLGSLSESESDVIPKMGFIRYVAGRRPRPSAFVPVRSVEASLRIAQLKSIGFKPIKPDGSETRNRDSSDSPKIAYSSAVVKRGVQEEYNKYTSEENNVVQYMDSRLCYEDIENEDVGFAEDEIFVEKIEYNEEESNSIVQEEEEEDEEVEFSTDDVKEWETQIDPNSSNSENIVDSDSDVPWHGWRKIGSNKEPHFVGW